MSGGQQEVLSSDGEEDYDHVPGTTFTRGRPDLYRKIAKMKEMVFSDEEGDTILSPIGSPRDGFNMGGRTKFLELKKKLEDDQARSRISSAKVNPEEDSILESSGAIDIASLLERTRGDYNDQSRVSSMSIRADTHPKFAEMYKQIKERDHKILDYESKINEMERQAVDMQDAINQRDQLICSKNEAVSMVHNKYRKELEQKEDELRKTQQTMFDLERNLSSIQDQFQLQLKNHEAQEKEFVMLQNKHLTEMEQKEEELSKAGITIHELEKNLSNMQKQSETQHEIHEAHEQQLSKFKKKFITLKTKVDEHKVKILDLDEERVELLTCLTEKDDKIAELETARELISAKILDLDEERVELLTSLTEKDDKIAELETARELISASMTENENLILEKDTKVDELTTQVAKLELTLKKMKALFQSKLKALKEEQSPDLIKANERVKELENQIAELEEEKGNFLLQKLEYEEQEENMKKRIEDLEIVERKSKKVEEALEIEQIRANNLEVQLQESEFEIDSAKSTIAELNSNLESVCESNLQVLKRKSSEALEILEEEQTRSNNFEIQLQELQIELEGAKSSVLELNTNLESISKANIELNTNLESISKANIQLLEQKNTETMEILEREQTKNHNLDVQLQQFQNELDEAKSTILELNSNFETVSQENLRLIFESENVHKTKLEMVQNSLGAAEKMIAELDEQLLLAKNEEIVDTFENEIKELKVEKESLEEKIKSYENKLMESTNECDSLKWDHASLLESCNEISTEIRNLREIQKEELNSIHTEYQNQLREREKKLQEGEEIILDLRNNTENLRSRVVDFELLERKNRKIFKILEKEKSRSNNLQVQLERLQVEIDDAKSTILELTSNLDSVTKVNNQVLERKNSEVMEVLEKEQSRSSNLEIQLQELQIELDEANSTISELNSNLESITKTNLQVLEIKNNEALEILKMEQNKSHNLEIQLEKLQNDLNGANLTISELNSNIELISKTNIELVEHKSNEIMENIKKEQIKNQNLDVQLQQLRFDLDEAKSTILELNANLQTTSQENLHLTKEIKNEHKKDLEMVQNSLVSAENKIIELHEQLLLARDSKIVETLQNEIKGLKEEKISLEDSITSYTSKYAESMSECDSLRWDHTSLLQSCNEISDEIRNIRETQNMELHNIHTEYQNQLGEREKKLQEGEDVILELRNNAENLRTRVVDFESVERKNKEMLESVERKNKEMLESVERKNKEMLETLEKEQNRTNNLETQLHGLQIELHGAKSTISNMDSNLQSICKANAELLERKGNEAMEMVEKEQIKNHNLDVLLQQLRIELGEAKSTILELYSNLENLSQENFRLTFENENENPKNQVEDLELLERKNKEILETLEKEQSRNLILDVQIQEFQIELDDAKSSISELNSNLEIISHENSRLMHELGIVKTESTALRTENSRQALEIGSFSKQISPSPPPPSREREISSVDSSSSQQSIDSSSDEKKKLTDELKEIKSRNGKMILRYKQLKEKHDTLVKENERLKSSKFGLDSTLEDMLQDQVKEKDGVIVENSKIIGELEGEKERLSKKIDLLERANEKLVEIKESQEIFIRQLQQEISGLKWRVEELENLSSGNDENNEEFIPSNFVQNSKDNNDQENTVLRQENQLLAQEVKLLQEEQELLVAKMEEIGTKNIVSQVSTVPIMSSIRMENFDQSGPTVQSLLQELEEERREKIMLELKIELLQGKILEIEESEMKCFEESLMLKAWTRELEVENHKSKEELEQLYNTATDGDLNSIKVRTLQNEIIRLVNTLQDRDRRCEQLTAEIAQLFEERDGLQLKLSNVLQQNVSMPESVEGNKSKEISDGNILSYDRVILQQKLDELEQDNYVMKMDLRREKETRRLVQEQLFFSQSSRMYGNRSPYGRRTPNSPPSPPIPAAAMTIKSPIPFSISSPSLLVPPMPSSSAVPLVPPDVHPLPLPQQLPAQLYTSQRPIVSSGQFQTVELESESFSSGANQVVVQPPPPSPVMRI